MTDLLVFKINFLKSHLSTSVHFATGVGRRSRVVLLMWSSRFFTRAAASKMGASNSSVYPPSFCKLRSSSNPTKKNLEELRLETQTALSRKPLKIRHVLIWSFFLTTTSTLTPQSIELPSWNTLHVCAKNSSLSETNLNQTRVRMIFLPHNDQYCYLSKYWTSLLKHLACMC